MFYSGLPVPVCGITSRTGRRLSSSARFPSVGGPLYRSKVTLEDVTSIKEAAVWLQRSGGSSSCPDESPRADREEDSPVKWPIALPLQTVSQTTSKLRSAPVVNPENQKKQRPRFLTTKQLRSKENRKRCLLQRKGFIFPQRSPQATRMDLLVEREKRRLLQRKGLIFLQRLLQATRMDLLVEREALLWKPVWHRKKPRIRLKKKFKNF
ncbi:uncharacterized protein LOC120304291 [Crotalus tigris]|uniref:uncharacterized protein LOC120304291 n=1 Tax=Crotalus tigris TaxID=88082 RepID=UPI00192F7CFE|nr:uncharacterized protein LOC120304291 [Crotalus tigris]